MKTCLLINTFFFKLKMNFRKPHCIGDCDFSRYYLSQAGKGFEDINVFKGRPYQRGHGIGSLFRRFGLSLVKLIGKHLLRTGMNVGSDVLSNNMSKENLKRRLKEGAKIMANEGLAKASDMLNQSGSGRKRKTIAKKYKKVKRKKKDVFSD